MKLDWTLTEEDYKNAEIIRAQEMITPLNSENMFLGCLYVILSATENHEKHMKVYHSLLEAELDTPEKITACPEKVRRAVAKTRFPNQKAKRICHFADYWKTSDMSDMILEDLADSKKNEFMLRNQIANEAPGLAWKNASFFLLKCGYENVVPLDIWMLRFLRDKGCRSIDVSNYRTSSGPTWESIYISYEKKFLRLAKDYPVTPGTLQAALWSKYSTWKKTNGEI